MPDGAKDTVDEALLRQRAYEIWVSEGRPDDRALDHWHRAARDLASLAARRRLTVDMETESATGASTAPVPPPEK